MTHEDFRELGLNLGHHNHPVVYAREPRGALRQEFLGLSVMGTSANDIVYVGVHSRAPFFRFLTIQISWKRKGGTNAGVTF